MKRFAAAVLLATASTATAAPPPRADDAPPPNPAGAPPPAVQLSPPSATAPLPPLRPRQRDAQPAARMVLQTVVGGALGVVGMYGGAYLGVAAECAGGCPGEWGGIGGLVLGAGLGLTLATSAGVVIAGTDEEHDASFGWTWVGSVVGGAAGLYAASRVNYERSAIVVLAAGSALGGTLMHRVTRTRHRPATAVRLVPFASGNSVGLSLVGNAP